MINFPLKSKRETITHDKLTLTITPFEYRDKDIWETGSYRGYTDGSGQTTLHKNYSTDFYNFQGWKLDVYNSSNEIIDFILTTEGFDEYGRVNLGSSSKPELCDIMPNTQKSIILYSNSKETILKSYLTQTRDKFHNKNIIRNEILDYALPKISYSKYKIFIPALIQIIVSSIYLYFSGNSLETHYLLLGLSIFLQIYFSAALLGNKGTKTLLLCFAALPYYYLFLFNIVSLISSTIFITPLLYALYIIAQRRISFNDFISSSTSCNFTKFKI